MVEMLLVLPALVLPIHTLPSADRSRYGQTVEYSVGLFGNDTVCIPPYEEGPLARALYADGLPRSSSDQSVIDVRRHDLRNDPKQSKP